MPKYVIEVTDEHDAKLLTQFPDPEALFRTVVADAVMAADREEAERMKPEVRRIDDASVLVSKETR